MRGCSCAHLLRDDVVRADIIGQAVLNVDGEEVSQTQSIDVDLGQHGALCEQYVAALGVHRLCQDIARLDCG